MILKFEDYIKEEFTRIPTPEDFEDEDVILKNTTLKQLVNNKDVFYVEGYENKFAISILEMGTDRGFEGWLSVYFQIPSKKEVFVFEWAFEKNDDGKGYHMYEDDYSGISLNDDNPYEPDDLYDNDFEDLTEAINITLNKIIK